MDGSFTRVLFQVLTVAKQAQDTTGVIGGDSDEKKTGDDGIKDTGAKTNTNKNADGRSRSTASLPDKLLRLLAVVESYDATRQNERAMEEAEHTLRELLGNIDSLEAADAQIDTLAAQGRIDPAFLLTMAKAYVGVKESAYTKEEVKDVMAHLYFRAKESMARQLPPEVGHGVIMIITEIYIQKQQDDLHEFFFFFSYVTIPPPPSLRTLRAMRPRPYPRCASLLPSQLTRPPIPDARS
jgi:hypothetical protein